MHDQGAWRGRVVLRSMAWERAKGELHSMLQTFWEEPGDENYTQLNTMDDKITTFIKAMDEGYALKIVE